MLKKKVLAVTKLLRVYKTLRYACDPSFMHQANNRLSVVILCCSEHNEAIVQLKQLTPSHKVPFGLLRAGPGAIKKGTHNARWMSSDRGLMN